MQLLLLRFFSENIIPIIVLISHMRMIKSDDERATNVLN